MVKINYENHMAKVRTFDISSDEKRAIINEFFDVVDRPRSKGDIIDLFVGLFTESEMIMMARRVQTAKLLLAGKTYDEIREDNGVGYQTIQGVNQWLHGDDVGRNKKLRSWLTGKEAQNTDRYESERSLLDKYGHHRVIKNIFNKLS